MHKIIRIIFLSAMIYIIVPASESEARTECYKDVFGKIQCSDNKGGSTTIERDVFGNDRVRDNKTGKTTTCYTDVFGKYICN
jgi:hypothetical protein